MPVLSRIALVSVLILSGCDDERVAKLEKQNQELQAEVKEIKKDNAAAISYDLQAKCSRDAKVWFNENWGRGEKGDLLLNYSNHYSKAQNKCFILVEYHYSLTGPSWVLDELLWDVYDNSQDGNLSVTHDVRLKPEYHVEEIFGGCEVYGKKCKTVDEFNDLVRPYLND